MSVRQIFEARGETYFRAWESEMCTELAERENLVIATGGGALVNPQNRAAFPKVHLSFVLMRLLDDNSRAARWRDANRNARCSHRLTCTNESRNCCAHGERRTANRKSR